MNDSLNNPFFFKFKHNSYSPLILYLHHDFKKKELKK